MRWACSIILMMTTASAHALSPCPLNAPCASKDNWEVQIVAALDSIELHCSKVTPEDASQFVKLAEQFFADRKEVVQKSRTDKSYPDMSKQSELEILKYDIEKQKQECTRVLKDFSEIKKGRKKAVE